MKNSTLLFVLQSLLKTGFVLLLTLIPALNFAQSDDQWKRAYTEPQNFYSIWNSYDQYIATTYPDSIPSSKRAEIKSAIRFFKFWKSRMAMVNGQLSYSPYLNDILPGSSNPICSGTDEASWQQLGPSSLFYLNSSNETVQNQGLVTSVLNDPFNPGSCILSAEGGGIWKRQANSNQWVNKTDNLHLPAICAIEILRDPFVNTHLYATTGKDNFGIGIIESFDNGETWSVMQGFPNSSAPFVRKIVYDRTDINPIDGTTLYAITLDTIYRSINSGQTWTVFPTPVIAQYSTLYDIETVFDGTGIVILLSTYAAYGLNGELFIYRNNGWQEMTTAIPHSFQKSKFSAPTGNLIFAFFDEPLSAGLNYRKIYKTTDFGNSWSFVKTLSGVNGPSEKAVIKYSGTSGIVYMGSVNLAMFKENNPQDVVTFSCMHDDIRDIDICGITAGYESIIVATDGGIAKMTVDTSNIHAYTKESLDGEFLPIGTYVGLGVSHSLPEFIMAGGTHIGTQKLENGTWSHYAEGDGGDCLVNWDDPSKYCWYTNYTLLSSTGTIGSSTTLYWMPFTCNPNNPYLIYAGSNGIPSKLYIYDQKNILPTKIRNLPPGLNRPGAICVGSDNKIYMSDDEWANSSLTDRFIVSSDDGLTWNDLCGGLVYRPGWDTMQLGVLISWRTIERIVCNPDDPNEIWVTIGGLETNGGGTTPVNSLYRVLHSQDGGQSWNDFSEGLTAFPAVSIIYQPGSNKRLFVGTDAGVYYRDATMNQWECFNNGLPIVPIAELEYSPCDKYLYASTYSRSMFKTYVPFDDIVTTIPANTNVTWSQNKEISGDLIIEANSVLTITGTIYMPKESKIIVKPSGKLFVIGGTLTSRCGMWAGIEVWGNPAFSQTAVTSTGTLVQGHVSIINGGTIKNAEIGILASARSNDQNEEDPYGFSGGIVSADSAFFVNNRIAVQFDPYNQYNFARFRRTHFMTTANLQDNTLPDCFVQAIGVSPVTFNGCTFRNTRHDNEVFYESRGKGVSSLNSELYFDTYCLNATQPCSNEEPCVFEKLTRGIYALNAAGAGDIHLSKTKFLDNIYGAYFSGYTSVAFLQILSNTFRNGPPYPTYGYGLYLDQCTGFHVEDNEFYQEHTELKGIGLVVNNSDTLPNEIYRNGFHHLKYATLSQNENSNYNPPLHLGGLCYKCNKFVKDDLSEPNLFDFAITYDQSFNNRVGIARNQGSYLSGSFAPVGNMFQPNPATSHYDFYNEGNDIDYYYHDWNQTGFRLQPQNIYGTVRTHPVNEWFYQSSSCPSTLSGGGSSEDLDQMMLAQSLSDSLGNSLMSLVDGGSTETLNLEVQISTPTEALQVRNELLNESPYLSDTVMQTSVGKEDVLNNAMIRDVLVANPQSAKSEAIMNMLEYRTVPMPDYMMEQILAGEDTVGAKESLQAKKAWWDKEATKAYSRLLNHFEGNGVDSLMTDSLMWILDYRNTLSSRYDKANWLLARGAYDLAAEALNEIPISFNLNTIQTSTHQAWQELYGASKIIQSDTIHAFWVDSVQANLLQSIMQSNEDLPGTYARNILLATRKIAYHEPVILPDTGLKMKKKEKYRGVKELATEKIISVYPNPAQDYLILRIKLPDGPKQALVILYDTKGNELLVSEVLNKNDQLIVPVRHLKSGTYLLVLKINENNAGTAKITILR